MNPYARDKSRTKAGVPKPDLSGATDADLETWIDNLRQHISQSASLRAHLEDQLRKRRKAAQKEQAHAAQP